MHKNSLLKALDKVGNLAQSSKVHRLLHNPFKYAFAIFFKSIIYPIKQKEIKVSSQLFTGRKLSILLPAATDIFLIGGKSHISEINLAKFLILNLNEGDVFWDIGAHYGYFSLIASDLVGAKGQVVAIEAAPKTFNIIKENTQAISNTQAINCAVTDKNEKIIFHEFPNQFSEYNSTDLSQFESEQWFQQTTINKIEVDGIKLEKLLDYSPPPQLIKIDVEGGEFDVIKSGIDMLQQFSITVVMEFLEPKRNNLPHVKASELLKNAGYIPYIINNDGHLAEVVDINHYLVTNNFESDNIVFKK